MITVERSDFVSVPVTDLERSTAFFRDTLGLEQVDHGGWPEFQLGENVSLYLVDPTNIAEGVAFAGETFDTGVCHMAHFTDPDGNVLMLHRRYAPGES